MGATDIIIQRIRSIFEGNSYPFFSLYFKEICEHVHVSCFHPKWALSSCQATPIAIRKKKLIKDGTDERIAYNKINTYYTFTSNRNIHVCCPWPVIARGTNDTTNYNHAWRCFSGVYILDIIRTHTHAEICLRRTTNSSNNKEYNGYATSLMAVCVTR